ncbi:MAG: hypothetical protein ACO3UM_09600, partial [Planctomycetota bacterium]
MQRNGRAACLALGALLIGCQTAVQVGRAGGDPIAAELRVLYSGPSSTWPAPEIDEGVAFVELGRVG